MAEKKKVDKKNLLIRTLSGMVICLVMLGVSLPGGWIFFAFSLIVSFLGLFEFYRALKLGRTLIGFSGAFCGLVYWIFVACKLENLLFPAFIGSFLVMAGVYVFDFKNTDFTKMSGAFAGFLYTVVLFSCFYRLRIMEDGLYLLYLVFIASWGTDIFAYLVGIVFGRHPMAPVLSPKKTWEGMAGGLFGAASLGAIYGAIFGGNFTAVKAPVIACVILCTASSLISMVGDLFASAVKRNYGIKDYSRLIPGHGGILDRFDSCIFVSPVIFLLAELFI